PVGRRQDSGSSRDQSRGDLAGRDRRRRPAPGVLLHVRTTLRWIFAAAFLTLALNPAVDRIESVHLRGRHPFPRWLSIILVYLITFGVFVFLVLQVVPPIITEFEHLGSKVPGYIADFR